MVPNPNVSKAFVYKIADVAPPTPVPVVLPLSELARKDGFIHLSDAKQVRGIQTSLGRHSRTHGNSIEDTDNGILVLQRYNRAVDLESVGSERYGSEVAGRAYRMRTPISSQLG